MAVSIRQADWERDGAEMLEMLQQNLPALPHERLFSWLYLRNPEGQALGWIATDPPNKGIVGVVAAFPRRIYCSATSAASSAFPW
jgi:hypothetical protein